MKCPRCGKEINNPSLPSKPFCSDRCKLIDLGKWISEEYRFASMDGKDNDVEAQATLKDPTEE